jgi:hypothetical protein
MIRYDHTQGSPPIRRDDESEYPPTDVFSHERLRSPLLPLLPKIAINANAIRFCDTRVAMISYPLRPGTLAQFTLLRSASSASADSIKADIPVDFWCLAGGDGPVRIPEIPSRVFFHFGMILHGWTMVHWKAM